MVQSGYLSGTRVKILRDEPPWDSFALDSTLAEIGLTEGTAGNQFNVCPSFDLPSIDLDSGNDLLIISNDQPQGFYDNLAINMEMVIDFIRAGGTVLWETCDLAWNYGSYAAAGLDTLPGQIQLIPILAWLGVWKTRLRGFMPATNTCQTFLTARLSI
jgi:hypothetical protein